jgi:hypothetical protein
MVTTIVSTTPDAPLHDDEHDDADHSDDHQAERRRRRPPQGRRPVHRVGERADRRDDEAEAEPVDVLGHGLVPAFVDRRVREHDQHERHGHVHEQDRAPVEHCREATADEGSERLADGGDAEDRPHGSFDLRLREGVRHDREAA